MNINKLLLTGNLVADPELTETKNGKSLVKVALANNDSFLTESGDRETVTSFVDLQLWGKSAEALAKNGKKGQELFIEGQVRQERWTDKQGANQLAPRRARRFVAVHPIRETQLISRPAKSGNPTGFPDLRQSLTSTGLLVCVVHLMQSLPSLAVLGARADTPSPLPPRDQRFRPLRCTALR
jgi:single stranded DNA-binding protein